jgi:hypothetical protein
MIYPILPRPLTSRDVIAIAHIFLDNYADTSSQTPPNVCLGTQSAEYRQTIATTSSLYIFMLYMETIDK